MDTAFEFKPSIYIIPSWNSTKYPLEETDNLEMIIARANLSKDTLAKQGSLPKGKMFIKKNINIKKNK